LPRRRLHAASPRTGYAGPRPGGVGVPTDGDGGGVGGQDGIGERGGGAARRSEVGTRAWIAPGEPIISLRGVTKSFGSHTVLEDITFDVPKGRITAILGPSGTGKSVLLKNILGLLVPERGQIWVDGDQIVGLREKRLYEVRKKFGVLFQDGALFGSMNLYDNIAFPLREHTRKSEADIRELVHRYAELVGLTDHLKKLPGEVSGGMKKRAGLARHGDRTRDRALRRAGLGA
jgi:ABC-type glutathione transport system ATPase component